MTNKLYTLSHCTYDLNYHIVWTPRYRGKVLSDPYLQQELKRQFKYIAKWKGLTILAWHVDTDHIHLYLSIPPKYSVAYTIQILKGKTSRWIKKKTKKFPNGPFWARGYFVSSVGADRHAIKRYIENQYHHQVDHTQLRLTERM